MSRSPFNAISVISALTLIGVAFVAVTARKPNPGSRNALWAHLSPEQQKRVRRGFDEDEEPIVLRNVPIDSFAYNADSVRRAEVDNRSGRPSKTEGPVALRYDPDRDTFFLIDGHHRLASKIAANAKTISVQIVASGYSDYWATPNPTPTKITAKQKILDAADAQLGKTLGGLVDADARERRAVYDKRLRTWIVEYDTDPAIIYRAIVSPDGSIWFESIGD